MTTKTTPTGGDNPPAPPNGDRQSPAQPTDAGSSPGDQEPINKAVEARLARERAKHEKQLAAAQAKAVAEFKSQHGITDDMLGELADGKFAGLYKRVAQLEGEVDGYRAKEAAAREELRQTAVEAAIFETADKLNLPVLEKAKRFVLTELGPQLQLDDDGNVVTGDPDQNLHDLIRSYLRENSFAVQPTATSGASSRPGPLDGLRRQQRQPEAHPLLGRDYTAEERARMLAEHSLGRR